MAGMEKKNDRCPGERLPTGAVKTEIISYVLSRNGAVPVSDLIKHLRDKYGIKNKKNIANHLDELKDIYLEKIGPSLNGKENQWDITKIYHLININNDYRDILLMCDKSFNIILEVNEIDVEDKEYRDIKRMLMHSVHFFKMFLDSNSIELKLKTYNYFLEIIIKNHHPELLDATEDQQKFTFDTHWYYFLFELAYELDVFNGTVKDEEKRFMEKLNLYFKFYKPVNNLAPFIMFSE
jgi:transposase